MLEHRRFLDLPTTRFFDGTDRFAAIGGQATVDKLVDHLYDAFEADEELRPLFGRELRVERANQKRFFAEWLGGPRRYSHATYAGLGHRHESLPVTRALAGRWLGHFRRSLAVVIAAEGDREAIFERAQSLALALVNQERPGDGHARAACRLGEALEQAADVARRGDLGTAQALFDEASDATQKPSFTARMMHAAAWAGKVDVVTWLLDRGADVNRPAYLEIALVGLGFERVIFVTPLCAARAKRRARVEALLLEKGALEDIFTAAYLGDSPGLARQLDVDAGLALAADPATDFLDVTPVDHAVAGRQLDALRVLLSRARGPVRGARALRGAAEGDDVAMVQLLLEHGADARGVGAGRWVLHPEIAPLLARAGASIPSGAWIGASCTGNQGRKDDPDFVRALLAHGARADDRRNDGVTSVGATALHYAAKAGFAKTAEVLLEHGADAFARDDEGRTPLDWLERAPKTVAKEQVRRLLLRAKQGAL